MSKGFSRRVDWVQTCVPELQDDRSDPVPFLLPHPLYWANAKFTVIVVTTGTGSLFNIVGL